jgi:hypothetical protein
LRHSERGMQHATTARTGGRKSTARIRSRAIRSESCRDVATIAVTDGCEDRRCGRLRVRATSTSGALPSQGRQDLPELLVDAGLEQMVGEAGFLGEAAIVRVSQPGHRNQQYMF